jgi:hypothetical protein
MHGINGNFEQTNFTSTFTPSIIMISLNAYYIYIRELMVTQSIYDLRGVFANGLCTIVIKVLVAN